MKCLDLFSGIGGFALASRWLGIQTAQFVEIDSYCQKVLRKNFPGVPIHDDITTFTADRGEYDLVTGGFPCQDVSCSNPNGRGLEGKRSGLFYELMRIVCECRPRYVVLENVNALLTARKGRDMGAVLWELSQCGYDAEWQTVSAASVGAPHLRKRIFIVAYPNSNNCREEYDSLRERTTEFEWSGSTTADSDSARRRENFSRSPERAQAFKSIGIGPVSSVSCQFAADTSGKRNKEPWNGGVSPVTGKNNAHANVSWWQQVEPPFLRVDDGFPDRTHRIRGLGNAVVPQCAVIPLKRVLELEASRVERLGCCSGAGCGVTGFQEI